MTREEAIHFAVCLKNNWTIDFADMEEFCDMAIEALSERTCEWIKTTPWNYGGGMGDVYGYYQKCSNCDKEFMNKSNFCPNCGADMRGKIE